MRQTVWLGSDFGATAQCVKRNTALREAVCDKKRGKPHETEANWVKGKSHTETPATPSRSSVQGVCMHSRVILSSNSIFSKGENARCNVLFICILCSTVCGAVDKRVCLRRHMSTRSFQRPNFQLSVSRATWLGANGGFEQIRQAGRMLCKYLIEYWGVIPCTTTDRTCASILGYLLFSVCNLYLILTTTRAGTNMVFHIIHTIAIYLYLSPTNTPDL